MVSTTPTPDELAAVFAAHRPRLRRLAHRMLGSHWDADDAVQETWLRLQRADAASIDTVGAWLTTVTSRVCVDLLRKRSSRHEDLDADLPDDDAGLAHSGPEALAVSAEDVAVALALVLDSLGPLERLAFVLHDVFAMPFEDVAPIVERTPAAARQLASRARRRVRTVDVPATVSGHQVAVEAFLMAARDGDFAALLQLLDPEVELRADDDVVALAAPHADDGAPLLEARVRGADAVARVFAGRAADVVPTRVDGLPAAVYATGGIARALYLVRLEAGRIAAIDVVADPAHLDDLTGVR